MGLLKIVDPMNGDTHEMIYNRDFKNGSVHKTLLVSWNPEEPVVKQIDAWEGDIPSTVKRFPSKSFRIDGTNIMETL